MNRSFRRPPKNTHRQYNPNFPGATSPYSSGLSQRSSSSVAAQGSNHSVGSRLKTGLVYAIGYVVVLWLVHVINVYVLGGSLIGYGVHPLDTAQWWTILSAPFIHGNFAHLMSNTIPGALFTFLIAASGKRVWIKSTLVIIIIAGAGTWLIGGVGTVHIGASGVLYGWFAYLLVRGVVNRSLGQILIGIAVATAYSGLIWGIFPTMPGVSWQAHMCGFIGGVIAGFVVRNQTVR